LLSLLKKNIFAILDIEKIVIVQKIMNNNEIYTLNIITLMIEILILKLKVKTK